MIFDTLLWDICISTKRGRFIKKKKKAAANINDKPPGRYSFRAEPSILLKSHYMRKTLGSVLKLVSRGSMPVYFILILG